MSDQRHPTSGPALRTVRDEDLEFLLALNEDATPHVNSIPHHQMSWFIRHAAYFRVAELGGDIAGFLVGLTPDADYDSINFSWFRDRYPSFVYVDRVVVASNVRRARVGASLYRDILLYTHGFAPLLACEVNLRPPNPGSMTFHEQFGFRPVGTQLTESGSKKVCLMVKDVPVG